MTLLNLTANDIVNLLRHGKSTSFLPLQKTIADIKLLYGSPTLAQGNLDYGYLYYGPIRLGYSNNSIDEFSILFEDNISFKVADQLIDEEDFSLDSNTRINEFIYFINFNNITWRSYKEKDLDYFFLKTTSEVFVIFDLEAGYLRRISLGVPSP